VEIVGGMDDVYCTIMSSFVNYKIKIILNHQKHAYYLWLRLHSSGCTHYSSMHDIDDKKFCALILKMTKSFVL